MDIWSYENPLPHTSSSSCTVEFCRPSLPIQLWWWFTILPWPFSESGRENHPQDETDCKWLRAMVLGSDILQQHLRQICPDTAPLSRWAKLTKVGLFSKGTCCVLCVANAGAAQLTPTPCFEILIPDLLEADWRDVPNIYRIWIKVIMLEERGNEHTLCYSHASKHEQEAKHFKGGNLLTCRFGTTHNNSITTCPEAPAEIRVQVCKTQYKHMGRDSPWPQPLAI